VTHQKGHYILQKGGSRFVKYNTIAKIHRNRYVVLSPSKYNSSGYVTSWKVLNTTRKLSKACELQNFFKMQGINKAVLMDTTKEADLPPNKVAEFFRVMFAMN
jgi:hypothetical protein